MGKAIIDPNGNIFYLLVLTPRIKFSDDSHVFERGKSGQNDQMGVKAWKTIRAMLVCDISGTPSSNELMDGIAPNIQALTRANIVVLPECINGPAINLGVGDTIDLAVRRFWDEIGQGVQLLTKIRRGRAGK